MREYAERPTRRIRDSNVRWGGRSEVVRAPPIPIRPGVVSPWQAVGGGVVTFSTLVNACPATLAPWR